MSKKNGFNWSIYNEQKQKEFEKSAAEACDINAEKVSFKLAKLLGKEQKEKHGDAERKDSRTGGSVDSQKHVQAYPSNDIGLETPIGRIIHDKDVRDSVLSYADMMSRYAGKDMYEIPPFSPSTGHQFTVINKRVVVWLVPDSEYTAVQFFFCTPDGIHCRVNEVMELADLAETEKQITIYINNQRRENLFGSILKH